MSNILNFALKIKGGGRRVAHAKSSDAATPSKFETCTRGVGGREYQKRCL